MIFVISIVVLAGIDVYIVIFNMMKFQKFLFSLFILLKTLTIKKK